MKRDPAWEDISCVRRERERELGSQGRTRGRGRFLVAGAWEDALLGDDSVGGRLRG